MECYLSKDDVWGVKRSHELTIEIAYGFTSNLLIMLNSLLLQRKQTIADFTESNSVFGPNLVTE